VVAVNKWDSVDDYRRQRIKEDIERMPFLGLPSSCMSRR
jgi:predicted GTPase